MIPLPRSWALTSAMLVGVAAGLMAGIVSMLLAHPRIRPDIVIALVVFVPSVVGLVSILFSRRRWLTALGAFIVALAPGWFGVLAMIQVVFGA